MKIKRYIKNSYDLNKINITDSEKILNEIKKKKQCLIPITHQLLIKE